MIMNSKLARSLVSAVAVGALSLGVVACGGEEQQEKETPTKTATKTSSPTKTVTEMETVTETETMKTK